MEIQLIQNKIHELRGLRVILDFDLADMYQVETKRLNESVKRNLKRFPTDFMFQLSSEEWSVLKSQIATSRWGGSRKLPYAFTEQGVAMLSGLLNSDVAIAVNINIMRAFVSIRQLVLSTPVNKVESLENDVRKLKQYMEEVFEDYNDINEDTRIQLELINETLAQLQAGRRELCKPRKPIGYVRREE